MKTVLITGASRGIGRAIAIKFAQNGYNIVINYNKNEIKAKSLVKVLNQYNVRTMLCKADVGDIVQVKNMVKNVLSNFGNIDCLINNAGVSLNKLLQDCNDSEIQKVLNTNLLGTINVTKEVIKNMISIKNGKIINISSIWGTVGASMETIYSASKGAINAFTLATAKELAPSNINVNCVCPGVIETDMMKNFSSEDKDALKESTPLNRLGRPEDIANLVYFLSTDEASFITGQIITVDGGFTL